MAEQAEHEDDTLEPDEVIEGDFTVQGDEGQDTETSEDDDQIEGDDAEDEVEVTFGDEAAPASRGEDSGLVKQLRAEIRKRDERLAALKTGTPEPQAIEVGPRPTIEACDYDDERFAKEHDAWLERKAQADAQQTETQRQTEAVTARFTEKVGAFQRQKQELGAKDFDVAGAAVAASLSEAQAAVVLKVADNSAAVIYALGRHPQKLATLAATDDLIEFAAAVARIEGTLKVTKRTRTPPEPDRPQRGSAPLGATTDKELERLEKEADRTNDRTKVVAYKRKLRTQGRS